MPDPWDDEDDTEASNAAGAGQSETELVKDLRKQLKAIGKERDELKGELGEFRTKDRQSKIADLLSAHEANPKIARFLPGDIELTKEAVGKWLEDEGDVFGYQKPDAGEENTPDPRAEAYGRIDRAGHEAIPPTKSGDLLDRVLRAKDAKELQAIIDEQGSRLR